MSHIARHHLYNVFRFIHSADPHLDSPLLGLEGYDGAPVETIRGATRRAFENLVTLALEERVDFVLIAGDLYDGDWRDFSTGLFFTGQMARLRAAGIPVLVISGNHDAASVITRKLTLPDNVHLFPSRSAKSYEVPGHPVVVHGQSFPNREVPENLVLGYPEPAKNCFNIGLLHTSLTGGAGHDTYAPCSLKELQDKGYDYWALGHVHLPQVFCETPWIGFVGNLQGRHVRETGARGCRLITVGDSLHIERNEFRPLDVVRWAIVEIDLSGVKTEALALELLSNRIAAELATAEDRLLAVRVVFRGATPLHGPLHRDEQRLRAECIAVAQQCGGTVWLEEVKVRTSPVYDLAELAERDSLTGIVIDSLAGNGEVQVPDEVQAMLDVLPANLREEVAAELSGDALNALLADVRAIILEALATKGGDEP